MKLPTHPLGSTVNCLCPATPPSVCSNITSTPNVTLPRHCGTLPPSWDKEERPPPTSRIPDDGNGAPLCSQNYAPTLPAANCSRSGETTPAVKTMRTPPRLAAQDKERQQKKAKAQFSSTPFAKLSSPYLSHVCDDSERHCHRHGSAGGKNDQGSRRHGFVCSQRSTPSQRIEQPQLPRGRRKCDPHPSSTPTPLISPRNPRARRKPRRNPPPPPNPLRLPRPHTHLLRLLFPKLSTQLTAKFTSGLYPTARVRKTLGQRLRPSTNPPPHPQSARPPHLHPLSNGNGNRSRATAQATEMPPRVRSEYARLHAQPTQHLRRRRGFTRSRTQIPGQL